MTALRSLAFGVLAFLPIASPSIVAAATASASPTGAVPAKTTPGRAAFTAFTVPVPRPAVVATRARGATAAWTSTAPIVTPRADLVGLRWTGRTSPQLRLRTRDQRGRWSPWVDVDLADGPSGGSAPIWTGGSSAVALAVRGPWPNALRISALALSPQQRARSRAVFETRPRTGKRARAAQAPGGVIVPGAPPMVARSEWDPANACAPRATPANGMVKVAIVHHTVSTTLYAPSDVPAMVLATCRYHRDSNGWNDLGYNFLVDRFGTIFEGRAGGIDQPIIGAHAQGFNAESTGIANLGTFISGGQTDAALRANARLIAWKLGIHAVPLEGSVVVTSGGGAQSRYAARKSVTLPRIIGHRDVGLTECPGTALYGQLASLRTLALEMPRGVPAVLPPPVVAPTQTGAVTLDPPTEVGVYGQSQAVTGRVTTNAGPLADADVRLRAQSGTVWQTVGSATTAADGRWTVTLTAQRTGALRAVALTGGRRIGQSPSVRLSVIPALTLRGPSRVAAGQIFTVRGQIRPAKRRISVTITRDTTAGGAASGETTAGGAAAVVVRRVIVRPRGGRWTLRVRLRTPQNAQITVSFPGDARHVAAKTPALAVTVVRR